MSARLGGGSTGGGIVLALAAALAAAGAVQAQTQIVWNSAGRFEQRLQAGPGSSTEVCGALKRGDAVKWLFSATGQVDFDIHYHEEQQVFFPAQKKGTPGDQGTLQVTADRDYCWMWTNLSGAPVQVRLLLQR